LIKVDGGVRGDLGASIVKDACRCPVLTLCNGRNVDHGLVGPSHELDGHVLPCSGRPGVVSPPANVAVRALVEAVTWAGGVGHDDRLGNARDARSKDGGEKDGREHDF